MYSNTDYEIYSQAIIKATQHTQAGTPVVFMRSACKIMDLHVQYNTKDKRQTPKGISKPMSLRKVVKKQRKETQQFTKHNIQK